MSTINQFVPMLHYGDAVGQHTLRLRDLLRSRGIDSNIYVEHEDPYTASETLDAKSYPDDAKANDLLVYQFATASGLASWLIDRPERLVVNYHNITPANFFAPWDNGLALHQVRAEHELAQLGPRATLGIAVSEYNRRDLVDAGFVDTDVIQPIVVSGSTGQRAYDTQDVEPKTNFGSQRFSGPVWLMVGRLAPNKAIEDAIAALFVARTKELATHSSNSPLSSSIDTPGDYSVDGLQHSLNRGPSLKIVGKPAVPAYAEALRRFVNQLGMTNAVEFLGQVDDNTLVGAYGQADVLLVTSEHEGFCLPVVEAMARELPVVAYRQGAIPEVLGDAGLIVDSKDPYVLAEALDAICSDEDLKRNIVLKSNEQLSKLELEHSGHKLSQRLIELAS